MSAIAKAAKKTLSLDELMDCAYEEIDQYRSLLGQARQSRKDATLAIFRAGEWLSLARTKFKADGRGKWTAFLKEYGIPRTTGWEAETLYKRAKTEAAVNDMSPTEAKQKFKVVKEKNKTVSDTTVPLVKAGLAIVNSDEGDGVSMPMTPRRFGEPPSDPDRDRHQVDVVSPRPKRTPVIIPAPTNQENDFIESDVSSPSDSAEHDDEPLSSPADEPPPSEEQHPLLTTIVQIVRRLEVLVEDLPNFDLSAEPKDAIGREIDHGIAKLNKLKGGIAR